MALRWIEGFELYEDGGTPPPHFENKYENVNQDFGLDTTDGRFFGSAMRLGKSNGGTPDRFDTPILAEDQPMWIVGFNFKRGYEGADGPILQARDGDAVQLEVRVVDDDIQIYRGTSTLIHTFSGVLDDDDSTRWYHFQFRFRVHFYYGLLQIKIKNGPTQQRAIVNTDNEGSEVVDNFRFTAEDSADDQYSWIIDDIYICDSTGSQNNNFLGDLVVEGIRPEDDGKINEWTPSEGTNYENVDDNDESNYNSSDEDGDKDMYDFSDLLEIDDDIRGVQINAQVADVEDSDPTFVLLTESNLTEEESDDKVATSSSYDHFYDIVEQDPDTISAWTPAGLNAAEFGIKTGEGELPGGVVVGGEADESVV